MSAFGWSSTTDDVLEGKDLSGQVVFITGANSGLGQETARAMAAKGAHVVMAGRDQAKLEGLAQQAGHGATWGTLEEAAALGEVVVRARL
jgi:NADP-dependent 3-hydroxy acid dehydrogenase YdfG